MINDGQLTFEEIINRKRNDLLSQRAIVVEREKNYKDGSAMQLCYNSQASSILDMAGLLQWVLKKYQECEADKLFPNCLDNIKPDVKVANYEAGDHGV